MNTFTRMSVKEAVQVHEALGSAITAVADLKGILGTLLPEDPDSLDVPAYITTFCHCGKYAAGLHTRLKFKGKPHFTAADKFYNLLAVLELLFPVLSAERGADRCRILFRFAPDSVDIRLRHNGQELLKSGTRTEALVERVGKGGGRIQFRKTFPGGGFIKITI